MMMMQRNMQVDNVNSKTRTATLELHYNAHFGFHSDVCYNRTAI